MIQFCDTFLGKNGKNEYLDVNKKDGIIGEQVVKKFARKCYRTLLVAYVDFTKQQWAQIKEKSNNFEKPEDIDSDAIEAGLTMVGIFGLMDPLRPGITEAVKQCFASGINVRMCTGDNIDTATAISLEAGIIT